MYKNYEKTAPADTFDAMERNEEWLGFGYIGGRQSALMSDMPHEVEIADAAVITRATQLDMTDDELFDWANSKLGRWFADSAFGCDRIDLSLIRKIEG